MGKLYNEYLKTYKLTEENSDGFLEIVGDLLSSEEVKSLEQYEQHLEINRLQHILGVSYLAYKICKKLGKDYRSAARAGIMHDLVYYDWREGETEGWHRPHGIKHPNYAYLNAMELCPDLNKIEADAIRKHMWPLTVITPRYFEGFAVTFADKYCATREMMYSLIPKYKNKFLNDIERL